ncbi:hypothetical protein Tsp_06866 [Trichinella spiralis]|uniref:hypothetical protein n=1 Tax=Trichinella spiralis TaxID=6334 RepID=UPI0001EFC9E7|nr:hypothetical protein Tsp_06866 [Trichinella spiralis]
MLRSFRSKCGIRNCIIQCTHFIHDSITLTSSEYDISDGALTFVHNSYGLRHPMKLVPLATLVHMDIKAFRSRPSVPLLITNSIITSLAELFSTFFRSGHRVWSCSHQFVLDVASQTFQITLRQSSSAGARIDLSCGLCRLMKPVLMPTSVHLAFQWRFLPVPVCLYLSLIVSQHFVLDSNGLRHQKLCLVAADGTHKLLRDCEDAAS